MKNITEKELEFLFPETEVEIAGKQFTLKPFTFSETRVVASKLGKVLHLFTGDLTTNDLVQIYAEAYEGVRDIIAMSLGIAPKLVDKFDQASAIIAIKNVVQVNKDFFVAQVETQVTALMEVVTGEEASTTEK